jgi:hypothetical protein
MGAFELAAPTGACVSRDGERLDAQAAGLRPARARAFVAFACLWLAAVGFAVVAIPGAGPARETVSKRSGLGGLPG